MSRTITLLLLLLAPTVAYAGIFYRINSTIGDQFYTDYDFFSEPDPTNGRVNYVNQSQAVAQNLTYATEDSFVMKADNTTVLAADGLGRNSVRISSKASYNMSHVVIFNIAHMPEGNGTWPAAWEVGGNWPYGGEVDILEGVNDEGPNLSSLHVGSNCTMPASRDQSGTSTNQDCNAFDDSNQGCGVQAPTANSYGPAFNANGGGWYAMERSTTEVKVWFWPRDAKNLPTGMANGQGVIITENWGRPIAYFPATSSCPNFADDFTASNIIINLTFCGGWAGSAFPGGLAACNSFVDSNPSAFTDAYWEIKFVTVYAELSRHSVPSRLRRARHA